LIYARFGTVRTDVDVYESGIVISPHGVEPDRQSRGCQFVDADTVAVDIRGVTQNVLRIPDTADFGVMPRASIHTGYVYRFADIISKRVKFIDKYAVNAGIGQAPAAMAYHFRFVKISTHLIVSFKKF
jgi:hypothetical protein